MGAHGIPDSAPDHTGKVRTHRTGFVPSHAALSALSWRSARHLVETTRVNLQRPGVVQAYTVLSADSVTDGHPAQAFFRERFVGLRQMLIAALRDDAPDDVGDPRLSQAASTIIGAMDGLQVQWLLDPEALNMPQAVDSVIESMIAWLNGRTTPVADPNS